MISHQLHQSIFNHQSSIINLHSGYLDDDYDYDYDYDDYYFGDDGL